VNLERTPWTMRTATPEMGEHTDVVLQEFGYDTQQIAISGRAGSSRRC
jgi:crotonobetainyl-CoA:carnitine CoA-transferase CaiB-like acyl-CoA transferase